MDANRLKQLKRAMGGRGGAPLRAAYRVATAGALVAVRGADRLAADPLDVLDAVAAQGNIAVISSEAALKTANEERQGLLKIEPVF